MGIKLLRLAGLFYLATLALPAAPIECAKDFSSLPSSIPQFRAEYMNAINSLVNQWRQPSSTSMEIFRVRPPYFSRV